MTGFATGSPKIGKNAAMNRRLSVPARAASAMFVALALAACGSGTGPGWSYAPLGPTPSGGVALPTPAGSPPGVVIEVATNQDASLAFVPATLEAPAATVVQVNYLNNSNLPHNINFFNGADNSAPSLGASKVVTGPNALESLIVTTPQEPGSYYFWCDVHFAGMSGTLQVQ